MWGVDYGTNQLHLQSAVVVKMPDWDSVVVVWEISNLVQGAVVVIQIDSEDTVLVTFVH